MLDSNHFRRLLSNPETTVEEDLDKLEQLLQEYPYLQSARALQLKMYKQRNSALYNDALRKTAAHTTDRDVLFQFITSELFTDKETESEVDDTLKIESDKLDVKQTIDSELHTEPVVDKKEEVILAKDDLEAGIENKDLTSNEEPLIEEEIKEPEETEVTDTLEIDRPLSFNKKDSYSFSEWMQLTRQDPIHREPKIKKTKKPEIGKQEDEIKNTIPRSTDKVIHLVDAFLKNNPRPKRKSEIYEADESKVLGGQSEAPQSLMTETLARVYLQQKNYKKAIQAYKILILKNPEKSGYFADKIRAIEKIKNKK